MVGTTGRTQSKNSSENFALFPFNLRVWLLGLSLCVHSLAVIGCAPCMISFILRVNSLWFRSVQWFIGEVAAQVLYKGNHDLRAYWSPWPGLTKIRCQGLNICNGEKNRSVPVRT